MRILFIGNSHTYFHGMPYQCRELFRHFGIDAQVTMIAQPGRALAWHAENPATKLALRYDDWDHIILQQESHPFAGQDVLLAGVTALCKMTPDNPSVWLMNTWCEKDKPENQPIIDSAFQFVSNTCYIPVILVSDAWHAAAKQGVGDDLYHVDGEHAGRHGSYIAALCITRALSGRSVQGLPSTLSHGNRMLNRVPVEHAIIFQKIVDEIVTPGC